MLVGWEGHAVWEEHVVWEGYEGGGRDAMWEMLFPRTYLYLCTVLRTLLQIPLHCFLLVVSITCLLFHVNTPPVTSLCYSLCFWCMDVLPYELVSTITSWSRLCVCAQVTLSLTHLPLPQDGRILDAESNPGEVKTFLHGLSTRLEGLHGKATQYKGYQKNFKVHYCASLTSPHMTSALVHSS